MFGSEMSKYLLACIFKQIKAYHNPGVRVNTKSCKFKIWFILDYPDKGNDNRRACSLYLSLMDKMGVQLDRFGDTDKRLAEL